MIKKTIKKNKNRIFQYVIFSALLKTINFTTKTMRLRVQEQSPW